MRRLCLILCLIWPIAIVAQPAASDTSERWMEITSSEGNLVGFTHAWQSREDGLITNHSTTRFSIRLQGHPRNDLHDNRSLFRDHSGQIVRIERTAKSNIGHFYHHVRIKDGLAILESRDRDAKGRLRNRHTISLPEDIRFDMGAGLMAQPRNTPIDISFSRLNLNKGKVENISIKQMSAASEELQPNDNVSAIMRISIDGKLRNIVSVKIGPDGHIAQREQPISEVILTYKATDKPLSEAMLDRGYTMPHPQIASPYRIPKRALDGKIRYHFQFADSAAFPVPVTGQQKIKPVENGIRIDICATCGPGLSREAEDLEKWRRPAPWMQSDWPPFQKTAKVALRRGQNDDAVMRSLMKMARNRISDIDYSGHFSAKSAWQQRHGDCTEDALVLATLGRAAGIPTLVANGLAYSRQRYHGADNAFIPHSWTLAYVDGQWRSYDMSLETFDAGHIALTIGEGEASDVAAAQALSHRLLWQSVAEIRARP
jgi:hypothetical protein